MDDVRIVTADELADILAVSPATVVRWARAGAIPELRPTRRTRRFDVAAVLAALRGQQQRQAGEEGCR